MGIIYTTNFLVLIPQNTNILVLIKNIAQYIRIVNYKLLILSYSNKMGFRENLRSQLEYSGILVKELAARSGLKKKTIDSYLGNRGNIPSVDAAVNIAKALGVSVEYLVTGTDAVRDVPLSSLPADVQEIVLEIKQLNNKDRYIILNLARLLRKR